MNNPFLRSLIERHHRLNRFKELKAPESIIESALNLYKKALVKVKSELGIDGEEYLKSVRGQIEYIEVVQINDIVEKVHNKCGTCKKYQYKDENYSCSLYDKYILNCGSYEDCGRDISERILVCLGICERCVKSVKPDEFVITCSIKGKNLFDSENCEDNQKK